VTFGVGGLIGNGLGGVLYEAIGMTALYIAAAVVSGWGAFLYVVGMPRDGQSAQSLSIEESRGGRQ